ncbi:MULTISPECIES: glycoside hydrolase family 19 protein [Sphingobacterium]|uniref:Glycoside hydrolase family 19 protein n=1 Tax=Sphingobacterium populi TaxID=1812824 RepID=A0ABW5U8Q1_9SPHI|nr:glycoside hydrolase family 19 protein [Sphingobacterium sp. CFCC 11742]
MMERIQALQKIVGATPDGVIGNETLTKFQCHFKVPTKAMVAHWFGNVHHETGGFKIHTENMNYTSAQRIMAVWPRRFKTTVDAQPFVRNPKALANNVYGGRMGNDKPDDGWNYRGRGALQATGKWSYERMGAFLDVDLVSHPEQVADKYYWESAIFYFEDRNLWNLVRDISENSIRLIRFRINGGYNGIDDTRKWVQYYFKLIS